jgi:hypothetical protein
VGAAGGSGARVGAAGAVVGYGAVPSEAVRALRSKAPRPGLDDSAAGAGEEDGRDTSLSSSRAGSAASPAATGLAVEQPGLTGACFVADAPGHLDSSAFIHEVRVAHARRRVSADGTLMSVSRTSPGSDGGEVARFQIYRRI